MGKLEFKAMTLIETIVAMVLITITFGIGIMIYSNISSNHYVPKKVKVDQLVQQIRDEMVEKEIKWTPREAAYLLRYLDMEDRTITGK